MDEEFVGFVLVRVSGRVCQMNCSLCAGHSKARTANMKKIKKVRFI